MADLASAEKWTKKETTRRQSKEDEETEPVNDDDDVRETDDSHKAETSEKDQVLCHPFGRVSRIIAEQHSWSSKNPQTVTVHLWGLSPLNLGDFSYLEYVWPSRSSFYWYGTKYNVFQLITFWDLGKVKSQECLRNLRLVFKACGRVRTLRVPARRLGALTRGASLDERKVPLGDHFGIKTRAVVTQRSPV